MFNAVPSLKPLYPPVEYESASVYSVPSLLVFTTISFGAQFTEMSSDSITCVTSHILPKSITVFI